MFAQKSQADTCSNISLHMWAHNIICVQTYVSMCHDICTRSFISFQSLAAVTHGHGTQALYWRCAKQKDRAKIFHCFKLENKPSSRSAPPTTAVPSLYTLDPQRLFSNPGPKGLTRKHTLHPHISGRQSCNLSKKH